MSVVLRTGTYGEYYGSPKNASSPCTSDQMATNAKYIYKYLSSKGWTKESVSALLGNMQAESSINPGRWQSDRVGGDESGHGYGLVQWTPYTKYTNWCSSNGFNDFSEMDANLSRIIYEVDNNIQWIATIQYPGMTFKDFATSKRDVDFLAVAFLLCYERPADQSTNVQTYRSLLANNWYTVLNNISPDEPDEPGGSTTSKKKKFKFILFNKRRNINHG